MARKEPTPEAQELLRLAAEDYAKHNNTDPLEAADKKTAQVMAGLAAQRGANRLWGTPPVEPQDG